jgi:DNA-binding response OmpR family regulator
MTRRVESRATPPIADEAAPVSALVVSPREEEFVEISRIFERTRWTLHAAATRRDALRVMARFQPAAAIAEADLPDGSWRDMLADLQPLALAPRLIVTSRLADDRLWVEVLNLGGYDVLAQPFRASEVIRVVSLAWRSWMKECGALGVRSAGG